MGDGGRSVSSGVRGRVEGELDRGGGFVRRRRGREELSNKREGETCQQCFESKPKEKAETKGDATNLLILCFPSVSSNDSNPLIESDILVSSVGVQSRSKRDFGS